MVYPAEASLMLKEASWPADARWVLTEFQMSEEGAQRGNRTPRFILAQDNKIVFTIAGNDGWRDKMWPKIMEVTGTKA